jgi:hypothetical protein
VRDVQEHFLSGIKKEGRISLTELISKYGGEVDVKNTPSDKNLVKRQLDQLARSGQIEFRREGRELVAESARTESAEELAAQAKPVFEMPPMELDVVRAYARQVEDFARTLLDQVSTLVRMIERAERFEKEDQ